MEKIIHILCGDKRSSEEWLLLANSVWVPAVKAKGASNLALLLPDLSEDIKQANAGRILGDFDQIAAVFEYWLPCVDEAPGIEALLRESADTCWSYLVTESNLQACPFDVADGERVPGITQWGVNDKPENVGLADFYREWGVHSQMSFDLHPTRTSYIRNAVARALNSDSPKYLGIVLERFPELDHFVDDSVYFGDPEVVQAMFEHLPGFFEFSTAISGGMSEFRWR